MNIVVYCSSAKDLDAKYIYAAKTVGKIIGATGNTLLYGGVDAGLMHITAQSAADNGAAAIVGVVPEVFQHRADKLLTDIIITRDLNERKGVMIDRGDVFVVLPGGIGTIDEWISTLSHFKVNRITKPIIIANFDGVFDLQISQLASTADSVFTNSTQYMESQYVCNDITQLESTLRKLI